MHRNKNTCGRVNAPSGYGYFARAMFPSNALNFPATHRDIDYNRSNGYNEIFFAVHQGKLNLAHKLLKDDDIEKECCGRRLIHVAAARGHEKIVCLLCQRNARIDRGDQDGNTPLHLAIKAKHTDVVYLLVEKNTVNLLNYIKKAPLHMAVANSNNQVVEVLLSSGANPNEPDAIGDTPLHAAVSMGRPNLKIITLLMDHEADGNLLSDALFTPLYLAVASGHIQVVKILVKYDARIDMINKGEISPLVLAIKESRTEMVRELLTSKHHEYSEMTALHNAAEGGKLEIVKLLMTNGYNKVNSKNELFQTPLYLAVSKGHLEVVKYLLDNGAKLEIATDNVQGKSLLHLCATKGQIEILKCLIEHGATIDKETFQRETPLHFAISESHVNVVKYLLECGANVRAKTLNNETPLHLAVKAGNEEIVTEILNRGVTLHSLDDLNCSALTYAVKSRKNKIVKLFIDKGHRDSSTVYDERAIYIAAKNGDTEILKLLLDAGCSLDTICKEKKPIHVAAIFGTVPLIELLIKRGADVNSKKRFGETPLHLAAASGRTSMVKFLLNAGASLTLKTESGLTALDYALDRERHQLIRQKRSTVAETENSAWSLQPNMFERYLDITEMILLKQASIPETLFSFSVSRLILAFKMRVTKESKIEFESKPKGSKPKGSISNVKFQPEIVQCILNYSRESISTHSLNTILKNAVEQNSSGVLKCLLEYDIIKTFSDIEINCSQCDIETIITIIDHIKDSEEIYNLLYNSTVQTCVKRFRETSNLQDSPVRRESQSLRLRFETLRLGRLNDDLFMLEQVFSTQLTKTFLLDRRTYNDTLKLLIARLVHLRSISEKNNFPESKETKFLDDYGLSEWYSDCELQIMNTRETKIHHHFDVTYFDILSQPIEKIANYVRQKELLKILEISSMKFPAYGKFIKRSIEKGICRKELFDACSNCLLNVIDTNYKIQLPSIVIDKILKNLSILDLRRFQQAGRFINRKPFQSRPHFARRGKIGFKKF
ncbi:ankyrin-2-like [Leptopilina heterotoma]|uniref:ankyrin-2-like n=1 Tax=Leptopilina heterotoma TaxID=63436 RepID=UPI001CA84706|nr:ankyrin-2-like [Leptopilina heterotoma]XP_043480216.1 ankyrin-2-like [Leptopilina heterotoma]XP_043480217.1 ankyrin-2-like [Leptopilina heterotoma]XP_043480218.1 ankyrin-2-like [Leptopilina heterotoma]